MTRTPLVSVIMPTYNRAHLIATSIDSVLNQAMPDLELIVVDDRSTDETEAVIERIEDPRIRFVQNEGRQGAGAARNLGIANARGQWIGFLDSDDQWRSEKLERQIRTLEKNPGVDGVVCGWRWMSKTTGRVRVERNPDEHGRIHGLPRWAYNICPDILIRRAVVQATPFDEDLPTYECIEWSIRLFQNGQYATVGEVLVDCYDHDGPRRSDSLRRLLVLDQIVSRHSAFIRSDRRAWSSLHLQLGAGFLAMNEDRRKARHYLMRSLRAHPGNLRAWAYTLSSSIPRGRELIRALRG